MDLPALHGVFFVGRAGVPLPWIGPRTELIVRVPARNAHELRSSPALELLA